MPILLQLGVPKDQILETLVREYDLPTAFVETARKAMEAASAAPPPGAGLSPAPSGALPEGIPVGGGDVAQAIRSTGPGPEGTGGA
mgnify:CR=1 FL=1